MAEIHRGALLEENAEFLVEGVESLGPILGFLLEELQEALRDDLAQFLDERLVLHRLARDVQGQVLAVHDALQEPEPLGQELLWFGIDQDLAAVQRHGGFEPGEAEFLGIFLRDEQQRVDGQRGVGAEVQAKARRLVGVGLELVEFRVFLVLDLVLVAQPERLDRVDPLAIEIDRE